MDLPTLTCLVQMQLLKHLSGRQALEGADDLYGKAEGLGGLQVIRTMARGRALRSAQQSNPLKVCDEYRAMWEGRLNAAGKAWDWTDVAATLTQMKRFRSMRRVFLLAGDIEKTLARRQYRLAHLKTVQMMKCIHQFCLDAHWRTAWQYVDIADPYQAARAGASEVELEAALATTRLEDDLLRRSRVGPNGAPADKDEEDPDAEPNSQPAPKRKGFKKKDA